MRPLCSRLLYSIVVLSVQLLLPSAILILAHARSVQIAVQHRGANCTATSPLFFPHTGSCQFRKGSCTESWCLVYSYCSPPSSTQADVHCTRQHHCADCTAMISFCYPHTDSCEVSTGCRTAPWCMLNVQLLLPSAILLLDHAIGQYKILYIIVLLQLSLHTHSAMLYWIHCDFFS